MLFGYGRKSRNSQKLHLQIDALLKSPNKRSQHQENISENY